MPALTEQELLLGLLAVAAILIVGRGAAEAARRLHQPEVLGELLAGFLLGPSVFGALAPNVFHALFLTHPNSLVLSGLSWLGAILLLLIAGIEVDLSLLRREITPGTLAAAFAIVPSLVAGTLFAWVVLGQSHTRGFFLGLVLSVTGVSVIAKILIEQGVLRRAYAQVIVAAGVASEVLVWLLISVVASFHHTSPLVAGIRSTIFAVGFFIVMMTIGRRFVFWAMRRVADAAYIIKGQLTLVLVLTFLAAAITQALGLHALLGAFVFGVLLSQSPRTNVPLLEGIQTLTLGLFGPIFFVLAGMRVDIFRLGTPTAIGNVLLLLAVATVVKVGFGALGARLGGLRGWRSVLVGVGLNVKGGTDVVVAILGTEIGLLSVPAYTMYAVVAILTVIFSPALLALLEGKAPPSDEERARLEKEEAGRRSYIPHIERVLVPSMPQLLPTLAASVVERVAAAKHEEGEIFDIVEYAVEQQTTSKQRQATSEARGMLSEAGTLKQVGVTQRRLDDTGALEKLLSQAPDHDLIAIGARPPKPKGVLSLGRLQDNIIDRARADVLVAIDHKANHFDCHAIRRILVPTNGLEYSMAAGDIAASLAQACEAELCILHVAQPVMNEVFWRQREQHRLLKSSSPVISELAFRVSRLGIRISTRVELGDSAGEIIVRELSQGNYDLVVMGGVDRGSDSRLYLGRTVHTVLTRMKTTAILLVTHQ